ncbi:MAG: DUF983 domain-containing protein [Ginsengibacter sp.]
MLSTSQQEKPGLLNLFQCKCPRCRIGPMFKNKKPYLKGFMKMHDTCEVCGQYFDLEVGFYYGSGYVSYGVTVAFSAFTLILWWLTIGISYDDDRVFYWLIFNSILLVVLQPIIMRISRTLWLAMFVKYDPDWEINPAEVPERTNEEQKNNW